MRPVPSGVWKKTKTAPLPVHPPTHPLSTFEEVDPLPATVAMSRKCKGCIQIIRNAPEAFRDVSGVIRVQDTILKAPVLTTLRGQEEESEEAAGWAQRQSPLPKAAALVPGL